MYDHDRDEKLEIPDFLKNNLGIQKSFNRADGCNYNVPILARVIALLCAFVIVLTCFVYVYKLFRVPGSMHEESVDLILKNETDKAQVIITHEPKYNVVKVVGKEVKYYIFDNKNNLIYPDIVRRDTIDGLRQENNEGTR